MHQQCLGQQQGYTFIPAEYELQHIKLNIKGELGYIHDIKEDEKGNLWIGSSEGLHVYDGYNVVTYRTDSKTYPLKTGVSSNSFHFFTDDYAGNLWISDNSKAYFKFNTSTKIVTDFYSQKLAPGEQYSSLAYHKKNGLYHTTINLVTKTISLFHKNASDSSNKIFHTSYVDFGFYYNLVGDQHWITTGQKTIRLSLDGKILYQYNFNSDDVYNDVRPFIKDSSIFFKDGNKQIIYTWNKATNKLEKFLKIPKEANGVIESFFIDDNNVYIGSGRRLFIFDRNTGKWQNLSRHFIELMKKETPGSLGDQLHFFFRKKDGTFLLFTTKNIFRLKKKLPAASKFRQENNAEKKEAALLSYRALTEDKNKNIYASFYTGISKKVVGEKLFRHLPAFQFTDGGDPGTYSLNFWKGNLLWNNIKIDLATGNHKYLFDTKAVGHCTQFLQNDSVYIFQWNTKILHCYDLSKNSLTSYPLEISMNNEMDGTSGVIDINDMVMGSNNNIWIASHYFGLCLISKQGKLIKQFIKKDIGITEGYITDLERVGNKLWFGCEEGLGVLNIETEKFEIYRFPFIKNGKLINRGVFSILIDAKENFYAGSSKGLLYFDTKTNAFFNLPEGHPLSIPEFNRASSFKSTDTTYYFGSTDGLYSFKPDELEFETSSGAIKPILLQGISVYNNKENNYRYLSQNLNSFEKLVLQPFETSLECNFSVSEFNRNVYYSYRIKGKNDKWTDYKPENTIQFYALQPGNYTLEVKASTNLTDENASYYTLLIEIKQVWYKKWWVISLFSITAVLLLFGLLRYRFNEKIKRQKDLAALRTKISSDLHDDVGTILSGLAMQSQMLSYTAKEEQKVSLNEISNMSRDAMERMRDTVWAMDSRKDKFENLVDRMRDFAEKNLPLKKMTHEFIIENLEAKKFIDPEKRQAIYLIFKEAITNIIKHSNGSNVMIQFSSEKNKTALTIKDNGSHQAISNSDGLGMINMKMRAEKIGGTFTAKYDDGFTVALVI
jgi:signal transduction histidine kinase